MNLLQDFVIVGAQGATLSDGFSTMVIGITVVFSALILLIILLTLSGKFFDRLHQKSMAKKEAEEARKSIDKKPVETTVAEESEIDDLELVAVITACVAESMGTSADKLQVRSIKRTGNAWGMSGRTKQLYN